MQICLMYLLESPWHRAINTLKLLLIVALRLATEITKLPVPSCLTPIPRPLELVFKKNVLAKGRSFGKIGVAQGFSFTAIAHLKPTIF